MNPDGQHHEIHNTLIDTLHHAIRAHPDPAAKANYGGMLAKALAQQAKVHAAASQAGQQHVVTPPQAQQPPVQQGQGLMPRDDADPSGGYIDQNISPLLMALIQSGGLHGATPGAFAGHSFGVPQESGLLGALLAQHGPQFQTPAWA